MNQTPTPAERGLPDGDWPEYVMLRDTKLHDDMGGLGQRIFTTAGAGYTKVKYVREDLARPLPSDWVAVPRAQLEGIAERLSVGMESFVRKESDTLWELLQAAPSASAPKSWSTRPSFCSEERPCIACYSDNGPCEDAPSAPAEGGELAMAQRLAVSLWQQHYSEDAPHWKVDDTLTGVLLQISNMTSGMRTAPEPLAQGGACNVEGTWLWGKLMDWCRAQGTSPANFDSLFAIAREAHKLYASPQPAAEGGAREWSGRIDDAWRSVMSDNNLDPLDDNVWPITAALAFAQQAWRRGPLTKESNPPQPSASVGELLALADEIDRQARECPTVDWRPNAHENARNLRNIARALTTAAGGGYK